jgi:hypothetical protein
LQDVERFKEQSKVISKELRLLRKDRLLHGTIQSPGEDILESQEVQAKLIHWSMKIGMGRGLERWICPIQGLQRSKERRRAICAVLRVQALLLSRVEADVISEQIRSISEECTVNAKQFAHTMGIADEVSASQYHRERRSTAAFKRIRSKRCTFFEDFL